ncbi:allophanate hydrolase [Halobacillus sp. Marseille-Q1614]|uniref:allophanate hydrolase n=1 Tax=Halobacillus sp. Marseille-Q1614 TaxID=2709134 RepID=UPI0015715D6A|nr:allophanate hydrolase [Halobacillus sp. Marseille-Q1614]
MSKLPAHLTIDWLQQQYKDGLISPKQVIEEIILRAEKNQFMNIWITPPDLSWLQPYLDNLETINKTDAPLWGIPFAVKDNINLAGIPTTAGCADYSYTPGEHAKVVSRLIDAGAIPVGKTNLDQFATGLVGTRSPYGETHNAIKEELISGGSSSGSAVAVARGQAAFSLGTDTAGSGRVPAALNNLIGFKPSLGAWSKEGVVPACESIDCVTVFAHTLDEAIKVDEHARGEESTDPWSKKLPKLVPEHPEKICLPEETPEFYGPYAKEYQKAWEAAAAKVKEQGVPVVYVNTDLFAEAAKVLYGGPWIAERWAALGDFIDSKPCTAVPVTEEVLRSGSPENYDAASLFQAIHKLQALKRDVKNLLKDAALVMPTCGGTWTREEVSQDPVATNSKMGLYTNHCNLLDLSAVAVPAGDAAPQVPFGITIFSLAEQEGLAAGTADLWMTRSKEVERTKRHKVKKETTDLVVCGLHMRGYPLEKQMRECGAEFVRETLTAPKYQLIKLPGHPAKPGMIKQNKGGAAISVEVWEMPVESLGCFTASIPSPLGIGKVELEDGSEVPGFICEGYAGSGAEDISALGGWRQVAAVRN